MTVSVLELFAGIGGCAVALGPRGRVVAAVDHDEAASQVYADLHGHAAIRHNLHYAKPAWFAQFDADLWWMSPPCQPYTVRGARRDLDDRRSDALKRVVQAVQELRPTALVLENVPGFAGSDSEALLTSALDACGYETHAGLLCPTALGHPAQRQRYYVAARLGGLLPVPAAAPAEPVALASWIDPFDDAYAVPPDLLERFGDAFHVVDLDDPYAIAACFTGAYGKSPVYAGSYLKQDGRLRWWTPDEILRSLGFPRTMRVSRELSRAKRYKLVGNSLSIPAVRQVLGRVVG
ncbi:MAG: DNA cytosine methyltransferase [Myxococcota bacterium]